MTLTIELINAAAKRAEQIENDYHASVLRSFALFLEKNGRLTPAQERYCETLLVQNSEEKVQQCMNFYEKLFADDALLREAVAVCEYYKIQNYWRQHLIATTFLRHLKDREKNPRPTINDMRGLIENKYALKVRASIRHDHHYEVGQLVMIRKSSYGELEGTDLHKHYKLSEHHVNSDKAPIWELPCMILERDHRAISRALVYNAKRGGARWYRVLPLGHTEPFDVMERDLKKCQKKKVS